MESGLTQPLGQPPGPPFTTRPKSRRARRWLSLMAAVIALAAIACGSASVAPSDPEVILGNGSGPQSDRAEIVLGISLYMLVDDEALPSVSISSDRDVEELRLVLEGMNDIWSQAGIRLEARFIGPGVMPVRTLREIARGDVTAFYTADGGHATLREPSLINGFYARQIGFVNGFAPSDTRSFFVTDNPSVHDRRVSSHELGHVLGLHHVLDDPRRLMFSGTNGMTLTEEEAIVARHAAAGILSGAR